MVCVFKAFSAWRFSVAVFTAASNSAIMSLSSLPSVANCCSKALSSSAFAERISTSVLKSSRDCLFFFSSSVHHSWWSASLFADSMSLTSRSLIICVTFWKGSFEAWVARASSNELSNCFARWDNNDCNLFCMLGWLASPRNCANERAGRCKRAAAGKYLSAWPETSGLEMISMAFPMASISPARRVCLSWNSRPLRSQFAVKSLKYVSSAASLAVVSTNVPLASSASAVFSPLRAAFSARVFVASSASSWKPWDTSSKLCFRFISSFCIFSRSSWKFKRSFSSMPTMLSDWNS
mmetsp:Transcript_53314/g.152826  ORF Transcript_53314/g.152826 Transcript_53314/m.152826 type:complete len:294 (+) Transcript_53314:617-1498(+)